MELLFGDCSPQSFISPLDKFSSRVSSTLDLIHVEPPGRVSFTSDLLSVQQHIPGVGFVASPS